MMSSEKRKRDAGNDHDHLPAAPSGEGGLVAECDAARHKASKRGQWGKALRKESGNWGRMQEAYQDPSPI